MRFAADDFVVVTHNEGRTPPSTHAANLLVAQYAQGKFDSDPQLKREVEVALTEFANFLGQPS